MTKEDRSEISKENRIIKTIEIVKLFLIDQKKPIDIAMKFGTQRQIIRNILLDKKLITEVFEVERIIDLQGKDDISYSDYIYDLILKQFEKNTNEYILNRKSFMNSVMRRDDFNSMRNGKISVSLETIFSDEKSQYLLLAHIILIYKLNLNSISSILNISEEVITNKLSFYYPGLVDYIIINFSNFSELEQEIAQRDALRLLESLYDAKKNSNKAEFKRLIEMINNKNIKEGTVLK